MKCGDVWYFVSRSEVSRENDSIASFVEIYDQGRQLIASLNDLEFDPNDVLGDVFGCGGIRSIVVI